MLGGAYDCLVRTGRSVKKAPRRRQKSGVLSNKNGFCPIHSYWNIIAAAAQSQTMRLRHHARSIKSWEKYWRIIFAALFYFPIPLSGGGKKAVDIRTVLSQKCILK
jgi:hypothetical protein